MGEIRSPSGVLDAVRRDLTDAAPGAGLARFEADSRQVAGLRSEVQIRDFLLTVDEPRTLGGGDAGPNPVELALAALATCQEVVYRLYAEALGVPLKSVAARAVGDVDLRGMTGLDPSARPGFRGIELSVTLESEAPAEALERLTRTVDAHCPVLDIVRNATPVRIETRREAPDPPAHSAFAFAGLAG